MYLYNPETFDPFKALPEHLHKFTDDARYFVHKLYIKKVLHKKYNNSFIYLKASYLRKIISERKYAHIKNALIDSGIIITDNHWIRGKKSIGYMLSEQFDGIKHKKIEIKNKRLIKKLYQLKKININKIESDVHKHLWSYLQQITINENYTNCNLSLSMIKDKEWFFIPDRYGRVHTNISNLKSSLRKQLRWKNEQLINIDICNSQPLFFSLLLLNYNYFPPSSLSYSGIRCDILEEDIKEFIELVRLGKIYEYIAEKSKIEICNRKLFKRKLFAEIFFGKNKTWETECSILFKGLFPNVYNIIKKIKQEDHTSLAKLLQRTESEFVINKVIKRCMNEFPEIPVFTIHDSIMTISKYAEMLQSIMLEEFNKIGIIPTLRVEV